MGNETPFDQNIPVEKGEELEKLRKLSDEERYEAFVKLKPKIIGFIKQRLGSSYSGVEDDIWQKTLLKAIKAFDNFRGDAFIISWLLRIAINETQMFLRGRSRKKEDQLSELSTVSLIDRQLNPEQALLVKDKREKLRAIVKTLPFAWREPIELVYFEGLTHEEAAKRLDISLSAFKSKLYRGLEELKKRMVDKN